MSLRLRIVLFTFAVLLPALAASAWMVGSTYRRERDSLQTTLRETTRALSQVVDRELGRREGILRTLSTSPSLHDWDIPAFRRQAIAATEGLDSWIVLRDERMQYLNTALETPMPSPVGAVPVEFARTEPQLSDLFRGPSTGKLQFAYTMPIMVMGRLHNLSLSIEPIALQKLLREQKLPDNWIATITSRTGVVIARQPDFDRWVGKLGTADFRRRISENEGLFSSQALDGRATVAFFSRSPRFNTVFVIAVPRAQYYGNLYRSMIEVAIAAVVLLAAALTGAIWAARRFAAPIKALQVAAADLEEGRTVAVPRTGVQEYDRVGTALAQASERIRASNAALEARVAEAVAEVEATHARLAQSQKLEAVGRLTGGVAHDFNNLLQTLSTGLHVLDRMVNEPRARPLIEAGLRAVNRAARLVQQMLAFSRRQPLRPEPLDFRNQLLAMETLLSKALPANITLHTDLASDLWRVQADPAQLEMALLNLVFNARDALPDGGGIRISARNGAERFPNIPEGDFVTIDVTDDGSGIAPDVLPRIFDPFFTTKPVGQGTGLGLAQVQSFATESGGAVTLRSALNEGTTVSLALPRGRAATGLTQPVPVIATLPQGLKLLFVEDDVLVAEVVTSALRGLHADVTTARSGDEALALLRSGLQFDVVFSDVVMPGTLNGIQLGQRIAAAWPDLPVVLASGYAENSGASPGARILAKPYSIDALIKALDESQRRSSRPVPALS